MQFRFSTIWMKTLAIHILIPHFPSPNLSTFLVYRCVKVHPHKRRPTILAIQHSTQHNGSRILGREKKRCVCGWKLPTNRIYDCLPLFLLRAQAIARPPARALAARIAGELLDCTYATAQRNMKCTPQLPLKFSNEKSCICCSG